MTEVAFDKKVEELAEHFERRAEMVAADFEKSMLRGYRESRLFRVTVNGLSIVAGAGLLLGARQLAVGGHKTAAAWCAGLGAVGLAAELLQGFLFRREK